MVIENLAQGIVGLGYVNDVRSEASVGGYYGLRYNGIRYIERRMASACKEGEQRKALDGEVHDCWVAIRWKSWKNEAKVGLFEEREEVGVD